MAFRFVHTADIHLDSPLRSLALKDKTLANIVRSATREAFQRICRLCIEEDAEALLIAGDLYDGDRTSMKTGAFLAAELSALAEAGVRVFIVRGNHDALSSITKRLDLPDAVHVFDMRGAPQIFEARDGQRIAVHGVSFNAPHIEDSLLPRYKPAVPDAVNIGLMHTSLEGAEGHDPYAPVSLQALMQHGYHYWGLGHIHKRSVASGAATVVMPGIPQGRHINEDGPKSVTLGTVSDDGAISVEERIVAGAVFQRASARLPADGGMAALRAAAMETLTAVRDAAAPAAAIVRLKLEGDTADLWRLRRDADLVLDSVRQAAEALGQVWVERLDFADAAPPKATAGDMAIGALADHLDAVRADPGFLADAEAELEALIGSRVFPPELRDAFAADADALSATIDRHAADGAAEVLARLAAADAPG